jgi:hypothetical protein
MPHVITRNIVSYHDTCSSLSGAFSLIFLELSLIFIIIILSSNDEELSKLLGDVVISQGGVVPHIDPALLPTKTGKGKKGESQVRSIFFCFSYPLVNRRSHRRRFKPSSGFLFTSLTHPFCKLRVLVSFKLYSLYKPPITSCHFVMRTLFSKFELSWYSSELEASGLDGVM